MSRLRGGIVGCGYFAQFHLEAWRRITDAELVCACDPDLERARKASPNAYASMEEMLDRERLDFVDIATRPETHLDLVRQASARGVAIICQKPMAPNFAGAVAMVEAAGKARVRLMIHENWRWQPWYRALKARIAAGDIGEVITYRFRIRKRDGHGPEPYSSQPYFRKMPRLLIYETMVHPIDTARFLFGEIAEVYAQNHRLNPAIVGEDLTFLVLSHESGLTGLADGHRFTDLGSFDNPPLGDASVEGEKGVLEVAPSGDVLLNGAVVWRNDVKEGYRGDSVGATQRHFIDCLGRDVEFETSGRDYLRTFAAVEACYASASEGRRVPVRLS